jgi:hypothetical protein
MGTNYYRIPTDAEMQSRKEKLIQSVKNLDLSPDTVERQFRFESPNSFTRTSAWDDFTDATRIHLGKRSSGWKFLWNFNGGKYYRTKNDLFEFIRSGRVVNEYGEEINQEEFIEMALNWVGIDLMGYYERNPSRRAYSQGSEERYIDGLRVSNSEDFC